MCQELRGFLSLLLVVSLLSQSAFAQDSISVTRGQWDGVKQKVSELRICIENQSEQIESLEAQLLDLNRELQVQSQLQVTLETETGKQENYLTNSMLSLDRSRKLNEVLGIAITVVGIIGICEGFYIYFSR